MNHTLFNAEQSGLDRVIFYHQQRIRQDVLTVADRLPADSPIERIFIVALYSMTAYRSYLEVPLRMTTGVIAQSGPSKTCPTDSIHVTAQMKIGSRRVDYVVWAYSGVTWKRLLVECDGHEFHERTKEQAAADRSFDRFVQQQGDKIFRFTGSEIVNEPIGCAMQVMRWADSIVEVAD